MKRQITALLVMLIFAMLPFAYAENSESSSDEDDDSVDAALAATAEVTEAQAKDIALGLFPGVVTEVELRNKDGLLYWNVEIDTDDGREAEVKVDAVTGNVASSDIYVSDDVSDDSSDDANDDSSTSSFDDSSSDDSINATLEANAVVSKEDAISIAKKQFNGAVDRVELEKEDGILVWKVRLVNAMGVRNDIRINAESGGIAREKIQSSSSGSSSSDDSARRIPLLTTSNMESANTSELGDDSQEEVKLFVYRHGAKVRLLQLELKVVKNFLVGEDIVDMLQNRTSAASVNNSTPSNVTSELDSIVEEMKVLAKEIDAYVLGLNSTAADVDPSIHAEKFVEFKKDSIDLTQRFRKIVKPYLTTDDVKYIARVIVPNALKDDAYQRVLKMLREALNWHNSERVEHLFKIYNKNAGDLVKKVREGQINASEAAQEVINRYKALSDDDKDRVRDAIREMQSKQAVLKIAAAEKVRLNYLEHKEERIESRIEKIENEDLKDIARMRLKVAEKQQDRTENRLENIKTGVQIAKEVKQIRKSNASGIAASAGASASADSSDD